MRLYTNCHSCKNEIRFSTWEPDRVELSKSKGDKINLTCKKCGNKNLYHVNEIKAMESLISLLIGLIIFLIGTPMVLIFTWDYFFRFTFIYISAGLIGILGLPFMVYWVIENEQKKKVRQFNKYKISE